MSARKGLTLGPVSGQAWHLMRRDGDLIPFSLTLGVLPILARIVAYLLLEIVLPLIAVVLMPRLGGFGVPKIFQVLFAVAV